MIKVWDFDFNQVPGPVNPDYEDQDVIQRAFDFNMELMVSLERRGFEGVFYSEHHFLNSLSPTPNLLIPALAARTKTLKIGVMGNVLPFHQPFRLAEELAMLDYLTNGRLEIGAASGVPPEFLFVNIPQENVRPMFAEVLDILEMARQDRYVTFKGKFFDMDRVPIMPRPRKETRRRHWLTIYSESSCRDAARRDFKVCTGYQGVASAAKAFDGYRDEAAKLGRKVGADDIGVRRQVLIWDTDAEAERLGEELKASSAARMQDTFKAVYERAAAAGVGPSESVQKSGVIDAAAVTRDAKPGDGQKPPASGGGLVIDPEEYITGSPKTVADKIIDQCRRLGAGNMMAYHAPTMTEEQIGHHYSLWEQVVPILQKADVLNKQAA